MICAVLFQTRFILFSYYLVNGSGVQLGPFDIAATNRPMVPAPGDYDEDIGGTIIGKGK
jgi:hypothetical protein